jgi:hypothetical protein
MAAESGHEPNRIYEAQDGSLHLNGAAVYDANEVNIKNALDGLGSGLIDVCFVYGEATPLDASFFLAGRAYTVKAITYRPLVVGSDGSAVTAEIRKAPSGTAIASGTILHSGTVNLKATINTNASLTLSSTAADLAIAAGDVIGIDVTGTTTAARGVISVLLAPA